MKNCYLLILSFFFTILSSAQTSSVGIGTTNPDANAILEVQSSNKGFLLPRLELLSTALPAPMSAHVEGLTVYNTATAGDVTPGYYYNTGAKWIRLADANTSAWKSVSNSQPPVDENHLIYRRGKVIIGTSAITGTPTLAADTGKGMLIKGGVDMFSDPDNFAGINIKCVHSDASHLEFPFFAGHLGGVGNLDSTYKKRIINGIIDTSITYTKKDQPLLVVSGYDMKTNQRYHNGSSPFYAGAHMYFFNEEDITDDNKGTRIEFHTTTPSNPYNVPINRLTIRGNGNVGISNEDPKSRLHVQGSFSLPINKIIATGALVLNDYNYTVRITNSVTDITLPDASTCGGREYVLIGVNDLTAKNISVIGGGVVFDDVSNANITQLTANTRYVIQSDGSNWIVIGR